MTKDGYHTWQYKEEDLDILKDPSVKAAFIVNPSNPPSYGLTDGLMKRIVDIVRNDNPNLMIITDDVYATYIPHFRSIMLAPGRCRVARREYIRPDAEGIADRAERAVERTL